MSAAVATKIEPRDTYRAERAALSANAERLDARDERLSRLRGLSALALLGAAIAGGVTDSTAAWAATALLGVLFLTFVVRHVLVVTAQSDVRARLELVDHALARLEGTFRSPERRGDRLVDPAHPYAGDLDLFGPGSLFEQLNQTETHAAETRLGSWLAARAAPPVVRARQAAARELASATAFRAELALEARRVGRLAVPTAAFDAWLSGPPSLGGWRTFALASSAACALATTSMLLLQAYDPAWLKGWLATSVVQWLLILGQRQRIERAIAPVCDKQAPLGRYARLIAAVEAQSFEDPTLRALVGELGAAPDRERASRAMARLEARIGWASARHNFIGQFLLNALFGWDAFCAYALDRWRARWGARVPSWLDALGELEALASVAAYAHDHPDYAWPDVAEADGSEGAARFEAVGLAHPLLATRGAVDNDVALASQDGAVAALMVTGSNMSGKSTLLRAIGVGAVMAQAGFPVYARSLRMTALAVRPSMRVNDSLDAGVSRFYREVEKLKAIVDSLAEQDDGATVLFLLDEVLHGTNSRERIVGAGAVVRELVRRGAIGAVSSHDLGLARLETDTRGRIRNVHFEDHIAEGAMSFDYRLREGPVATSNALRLMREVGLDLDYEEAP